MDFTTIISIIIIGFSLAMDAFIVSICDGIAFGKTKKRKLIIIPILFAFFQALMPFLGFFLATFVYQYIELIFPKISFALLLIVSGKMLIDGFKDLAYPKCDIISEKKMKLSEIIMQSIATSIDAFAVGISLLSLSNNQTIYLHIGIIFLITFIMCLFGIILGRQFLKLFKGRNEFANILAGIMLFIIACQMIV